MAASNWKDFANTLAVYARHNLAKVNRGAMLIRCTSDSTVIGAVFGNDNYVWDAKPRREVELVRQTLKGSGVQEIGFGLSPDGRTWALLVRPEKQSCQTKAGQAFQLEMMKISLDEAVQNAWQIVSGAASETLEVAQECHPLT